MRSGWRERFAEAFPHHSHLADGVADNFDFSLDSITLRSGDVINVQGSGVTAIVGANNAGKSTVLREVWEKLSHRPGHYENPRIAVDSLEISWRGEPKDLIAWTGEHASFVANPGQAGFQAPQTGVEHPDLLTQAWSNPGEVGALAAFSVFYGNAQARFAVGGAVEMRDSITDPAIHPVHALQDSKELLDEVSAICERIFSRGLVLDRLGRTVRLRVGDLGLDAPPIDNIPTEYRDKMASLRPLDEQGDGMRSLMGQLLPILTSAYKLVIIDEPEAFLHPPQAYALGVELGKHAVVGGLQVLVATHDRNFLAGLLASSVDVSVVRLTRGDGESRASQLDSESLRDLWTDPVLKYTNVLDGLFHRIVVVAEAEGDCAYLAAALDHFAGDGASVPRNEVLFVPTGGKDGMAKVCSALSAVRVPVVAAPDLDMLSNKAKLQELVIATSGRWPSELGGLWTRATADLTAPKAKATVGDVLDAIVSVLGDSRDQPLTREHRDKIAAQARAGESPWAPVKDHGLSAFRGEAWAAVGELLEKLDQLGVVLVREGELERLAPEVAVRKGPGWLPAALSVGAHTNANTQAHVQRILTSGTRELEF